MKLRIILAFVCVALFGTTASQAATTYLKYAGEDIATTIPEYPVDLFINSYGSGFFSSSVTDGDVKLEDLSDFKFITHIVYSIPAALLIDYDTFTEFNLSDLTGFHASFLNGNLVTLSFDTRPVSKPDPVIVDVTRSLHVTGLGPSETTVITPFDFTTPHGQIIPVVAPVPEPAAWAMLVSGFGLVGAAMRRRPARAAGA